MSSELKPCPFCGGEAEVTTVLNAGKVLIGCNSDDCDVNPSVVGMAQEPLASRWNRRADGWRPIETAPREDKKPLLLARAGEWACEGFWYEFDQVWHNDFTSQHVSGDGLDAPTHWMPLPAPPESEGCHE